MALNYNNMTPLKKTIIVKQGDKVLYEGEDKRKNEFSIRSNLPFDLRPADIINICLFIISAIVFVVKTDERIKVVEKSTSYLMDFAEASDSYHSAVIGTQFKGGKPLNNSFNSKKIRDYLNNE